MIDYRKYKVWQKAHNLVLDIYSQTSGFPRNEMFNLTSQINRAAVSIPTNIAEGCGRESRKELLRFLYIASGSAHELEYHDLKYISPHTFKEWSKELLEIKMMLAALISRINITIVR